MLRLLLLLLLLPPLLLVLVAAVAVVAGVVGVAVVAIATVAVASSFYSYVAVFVSLFQSLAERDAEVSKLRASATAVEVQLQRKTMDLGALQRQVGLCSNHYIYFVHVIFYVHFML